MLDNITAPGSAITSHQRAAVILKQHESKYFVFWHGRWFQYTGTHYEPVADAEFRAEVTRSLADQDGSLNVTRVAVSNVIGAMESIQLLKGSTAINTWLDSNRSAVDLIPVQNGLINIGTGKLEQHNPAFFNSYVLPYKYDVDATCPRWMNFLQEVTLGDEQVQRFLKQWFGYCLTSDTKHQLFLALWGKGGNGKGTLTRMLEKVVGKDNSSATPLNRFKEGFQRAAMYGKLVNFSSEASNIQPESIERLKGIVGEDPDQIEFKNKDSFRAKHTVRIVISFNEKPVPHDTSDALYRRIVLIRFQFTPPKADPNLEADLEKELPGILNWAIEGLGELREQGEFSIPQSSIDEVALYKKQASPTEEFFDSFLSELTGSVVTENELYRSYKTWMEDRGEDKRKILSLTRFREKLRESFPRVEEKRIRVGKDRAWIYENIEFNPQGFDAYEVASSDAYDAPESPSLVTRAPKSSDGLTPEYVHPGTDF